jgi:hypothetical protein
MRQATGAYQRDAPRCGRQRGDIFPEQLTQAPALGTGDTVLARVIDEQRHHGGIAVGIDEQQRDCDAVIRPQARQGLERHAATAAMRDQAERKLRIAAVLVAGDVHLAEGHVGVAAADEERRARFGADVEHVIIADEHNHVRARGADVLTDAAHPVEHPRCGLVRARRGHEYVRGRCGGDDLSHHGVSRGATAGNRGS